ncbi:chromophore lyase CpcT/CpeT [Paraferrimonas sedimenticola]|uniref:Chromophore lyase CpcT/CpeT 2 n=1 Tax=Paraferrimonas sedimenticola TaxID=375674 RepID=A0AA37RS31_9GAMM|nr:chromophore lyase CpcT/CpeT [Paraferrimonas sedimenticola]GLP95360.1 chromophore lyase CpcT/CpeT 2 [Paraferrimonas sedimenticola]
MKYCLALLALFVSLSTSAHSVSKDRLKTLAHWMEGHFTSEAQAQQDQDFFNIHLNMKTVWPSEKDYWLYVEQAAASSLERPYRQRVYRLERLSDNQFVSHVYTLDDPLKYAGDHQKLLPLAKLKSTDVVLKPGCEVYLTWNEATQAFEGGTKGKNCFSKLRGAAYAVSEVTVTEKGIVSWDRGYNEADEQVWGAVKAGYVFDRLQTHSH